MKYPYKALALSAIVVAITGCATSIPSSNLSNQAAPGADVASWSNAWVEIDARQFGKNIEKLRAHLGSQTDLCVTMKGDAYRHGLALLMPSVMRLGVTCIGVASNEEGRIVRSSGYTGRLLRLRAASMPEMLAGMQYDFEELIGSIDVARELAAESQRKNKTVKYHLALNSGEMDRNGIEMRSPRGRLLALEVLQVRGIRPVGIMTHFALEDKARIFAQSQEFRQDAEWLIQNTGLDRKSITLHAANSYATMEVPESHFDMVRPGRMLYGYSSYAGFEKMQTFKTRVASVNEYLANTGVTYGHTFVLKRDSKLANIPVGYSDAHRKVVTGGHVLIRGHKVPIIGAITMNTLMVDVTDHPDVQPNDEVVLYGRQEKAEIESGELQKFVKESMVEMTTRWSVNPKKLAAAETAR